MFAEMVEAKFQFLESEYGFNKAESYDRYVRYEKNDSFISVFHDRYDAVGLHIGKLSNGVNRGFSIGTLVDMIAPVKRFTLPTTGYIYMEKFASTPNQIEQTLDEHVEILKTYGQRVLAADMSVYTEMQHYIDEYWRKDGEKWTRLRAEAALAAKDFAEALKQYWLLGDGRKRLDTKRMEICERQIGKPEGKS